MSQLDSKSVLSMLKGKSEKIKFSESHDNDQIPIDENTLVKVAPKKRSKKLSAEE